MKKNLMMRMASVLLIAVLMSTCAISGTFAKYVTSAEGTDTARVAKWGVTITPNGTLFEKQYGKDDGTYTLGDDTVVSSDEWKLVAPGTTDGLTEVVLAGTPEVATRVTYAATVNLDGWVLSDSTEYCPIVISVEGVTYGTNVTDATNKYATVAELETAVKNAIEACKKDYEPNTNLATKATDVPSVTWSWAFETGADEAAKVENNKKDTDLGNKAAAGNHAVIQITITTTVTQID